MSDPDEPYVLRSMTDVLGTVPYLLGYHPSNSVVAVYLGADNRVQVVAGVDLAMPATDIAEQFGEVAARQRSEVLVIVGYGPQAARTVSDVACVLAPRVQAVFPLLVADGHYFCLRRGCECPAASGIAFDPRATRTAAQFTVQGLVALPSRDDLLALVEPNPAAQSAIDLAITALAGNAEAARPTVASLLQVAECGDRLTDEQVARLVTLLASRDERDAAWLATSDKVWQRDLWLDVTRRAPSPFVAAPAALAAWSTWMRGEDHLALAAAQRALAANPRDTMAKVIITGIRSGVAARDILKNWPAPAIARAATRTQRG